jgi:hypothetical protein
VQNNILGNFHFLKGALQEIIESFKIVFIIKLLNKLKKFLNLCEKSVNTSRTKTKNLPQNLTKSWDVIDYHP